ncbi:MAG: sulfatase-like hydrolase/transferase, partial [Thermoanaerobaculia bacterium]
SDIFSLILTPELKNDLGGFFYYSENTAVYDQTIWSVPSVFLGVSYDFASSQLEYQNRAFNTESSVLDGLKKAGYSTLAYTRKLYSIRLELFDKTIQHVDNISAGNRIDNARAFRSLWIYRHVPRFAAKWFADRGWSIDRHDLERFRLGTFLPSSAPVESYLSLQQFLKDEESLPESNRYTFIHLFLPHTPYVYGADCTEQKPSTVIAQSQCAARLIIDILDRLKELGRFDSSLVIVHGDHGDRYSIENGELVPGTFRSPRTLLLVKPGGRRDTREFETLRAKTTLLDIAPTLLEFAGQESNSDHEGTSLLETSDSLTREKRYYYVFGGEQLMKQYVIEDGPPEFEKSIELERGTRTLALVDSESIPIFFPDRIVEAETGYLSGATDTRSDIRDTVGQYVSNGSVHFKFKIETDGVFQLRARLVTPSGNNNSSFLRIDDGPSQVWHMAQSDHWGWHTAPVQWKLNAGIHLLSIEYREPVYLDQIELKEQSLATE